VHISVNGTSPRRIDVDRRPHAKWVYATPDFTSRSDVILQATYKNAVAGAPAAMPAGAPVSDDAWHADVGRTA
jgi:hypothetical protein